MTEETKRPTYTIGCGIIQGLQMRLMDPKHGGIVTLKHGSNPGIDKDFVEQWRAQNSGFTGMSLLTFVDDVEPTTERPAPATDELRDSGPTVQEWVDAGYNPHAYPPSGWTSKSTPGEIDAAVYAWDQAQAQKAADEAKAAETASSGTAAAPAEGQTDGAAAEDSSDADAGTGSAPAETTATSEPPADEASQAAPEARETAS